MPILSRNDPLATKEHRRTDHDHIMMTPTTLSHFFWFLASRVSLFLVTLSSANGRLPLPSSAIVLGNQTLLPPVPTESTMWSRRASNALTGINAGNRRVPLLACWHQTLSTHECAIRRRMNIDLPRQRQPPLLHFQAIRQQSTVSSATLSQRQMADLEDTLTRAIGQTVVDPILQRDLVSLDWLSSKCFALSQDGKTVNLLLRLPSLLHPNLEELKSLVAKEATLALKAWKQERMKPTDDNTLLNSVNVEAVAMSPTPLMSRLVDDPDEMLKELGPGLESVGHVLAVYSCKGGVGKSTIAVNLAYELARQGGRVGLLDLDLYGPSLPLLVKPQDKAIRKSVKKGSGMIYPIEHEGVRLLSLGFVNTNSGVQGSGENNGAAIMRGPLVVKVVAQLLKGTDWGELDVLILDLPPGTGDVQLAVCQELALSGAVAVSTPSKLATEDTRKGIEMFTSLGVPTLAVVENMSYFVCDGGGKHYPFGKGNLHKDSTLSQSTPSVQLPISMAANDATESAEPLCLARPDTAKDELVSFESLGKVVSRELLRVHYGDTEISDLLTFPSDDSNEPFQISSIQLGLDNSTKEFTLRLFSDAGAIQKRIDPEDLRSRDPKTGDDIPDSPFHNQAKKERAPLVKVHSSSDTNESTKKVSPSLTPVKVQRKGRYGFAVEWADAATIIYSKTCLARAAGGVVMDPSK